MTTSVEEADKRPPSEPPPTIKADAAEVPPLQAVGVAPRGNKEPDVDGPAAKAKADDNNNSSSNSSGGGGGADQGARKPEKRPSKEKDNKDKDKEPAAPSSAAERRASKERSDSSSSAAPPPATAPVPAPSPPSDRSSPRDAKATGAATSPSSSSGAPKPPLGGPERRLSRMKKDRESSLRGINTGPELERTISLKNLAARFVGGKEKEPEEPVKQLVPQDENEKPFPGIRLHIISSPQEPLSPSFPGIPLHLAIQEEPKKLDEHPRPAFPGLPLHVIDEKGQRKTYVGQDEKEWTVPSSPRSLPADILERSHKKHEVSSSPPPSSPTIYQNLVCVSHSGICALQGLRPNMEDTSCAFDVLKDIIPLLPWEARFSYYAVYDGHAGPQCAELLKEILHFWIIHHPSFAQGKIADSIRGGFHRTDTSLVGIGIRENWKSGSTAAIAVVVNNVMFIANVGDSEIILAKRKHEVPTSPSPSTLSPRETVLEPLTMTAKHKPTNPDEKMRIEAIGGRVVFGRLFGELAVSRAFGDKDFKRPFSDADYLTVEPFIVEIKLNPREDEFMILASDGLWDKVAPQEAVEIVRDLKNEGKTPSEISTQLANTAFAKKSKDNITVIVVFFDWIAEDIDRKEREAKWAAQPRTSLADEVNLEALVASLKARLKDMNLLDFSEPDDKDEEKESAKSPDAKSKLLMAKGLKRPALQNTKAGPSLVGYTCVEPLPGTTSPKDPPTPPAAPSPTSHDTSHLPSSLRSSSALVPSPVASPVPIPSPNVAVVEPSPSQQASSPAISPPNPSPRKALPPLPASAKASRAGDGLSVALLLKQATEELLSPSRTNLEPGQHPEILTPPVAYASTKPFDGGDDLNPVDQAVSAWVSDKKEKEQSSAQTSESAKP